MDTALFENKYLMSAASAAGAVLLTVTTERILRKRARFTYHVHHQRLGGSADHVVFGSVRMTWNGNVVPNLFVSTVELVNESMQDFDNVLVVVHSKDTMLLSEQVEMVGTTSLISWSEGFAKQLAVTEGEQPTDQQRDLHSRRREFLLPVMNRGQVVRLTFINVPRSETPPSIWLDVNHKGIRVQFHPPQQLILGVSQKRASLIGVLGGVVLIAAIVHFCDSTLTSAIVAMVYGLVAQVPGVAAIKIWRWIRGALGS